MNFLKLTWKPHFQNVQNPSHKDSDLQVKMCFTKRKLHQAVRFYRDRFSNFIKKKHFSSFIIRIAHAENKVCFYVFRTTDRCYLIWLCTIRKELK